MISTGQLIIDLTAIQKNWQLLNQKTGVDTECAAVVKANAYGLGAVPVARSLIGVGCRTFFVATLDEAIELREAVVGEYKIIVLGGMASNHYKECARYQLTPTLVTFQQLSLWQMACSQDASQKEEWQSPVIKIDTGMHRLGLSLNEIKQLILEKNLLTSLSPNIFMSHLACADEPSHPLNNQQLSAFCYVLNELKQLLPNVKASFANSSGIYLGNNYQFDIVRPGVSLYGANPTLDLANPMTPVVKLSVPINQIKGVPVGDSVGYGASYKAKKDTRIAVTFGGYADGLFRILGSGGKGFYCGYPVPIAGRVSMDSIAFDISSVPDALLSEENNMIEILGEHQTVDQLAVQASTIAYEILTSLGQRYHRTYQGGVVA